MACTCKSLGAPAHQAIGLRWMIEEAERRERERQCQVEDQESRHTPPQPAGVPTARVSTAPPRVSLARVSACEAITTLVTTWERGELSMLEENGGVRIRLQRGDEMPMIWTYMAYCIDGDVHHLVRSIGEGHQIDDTVSLTDGSFEIEVCTLQCTLTYSVMSTLCQLVWLCR